jgi:hypothetical protein
LLEVVVNCYLRQYSIGSKRTGVLQTGSDDAPSIYTNMKHVVNEEGIYMRTPHMRCVVPNMALFLK